MSTKACEIILGQRFRVKYSKSMDEYMCDRSFVMKNALGWKRGALLLSVACFTLGPWTCSVQTESVVGALKGSLRDPAGCTLQRFWESPVLPPSSGVSGGISRGDGTGWCR